MSSTESDSLLEAIPVGVFSTAFVGPADIVTDCNIAFADVYDFTSVVAIIGVDIRGFDASPENSHRYRAALRAAALQGQSILGWKLSIRTREGRLKTIEVNCRAKHENGECVGSIGAIRDITEEEMMRDEVSRLTRNIDAVTNDVDSVLHVFRQTLMHWSLSARSVESVLAGAIDADEAVPSDDELEAAVEARLREMVTGTKTVVTKLAGSTEFSLERDRLSYLVDTLATYRLFAKPQWRGLWLEGSVEIAALLKRVGPRLEVRRAVYRSAITAAEQIGRLTALATLKVARSAILAVDAPIAALREYVTSGKRPPEPRERLCLQDVVRDAIRDLTPFATLRKVRIEFDELGLVYIEAKRGAVGRAIVNVLHNAIKYSWQRENDRTAIQVAVRADHQFAIVSVENWGVPIPKDEIETGLVFELGYRGRLASDGGRVGTGVGLSDSLRVAHDHDGSLEIQSKPAQAQQSQTDYHQPFVTIVSLRLALRPHVAAEEW